MGSARIKGRQLMLTIDGTDQWADMTAVTIENEEAEADTVTFEDAATAGGARQYFLNITAVQSTETASFWRMAWDSTGTEVPFVYAPHGNELPSEAQPHFTGTCKVGPPPVIGGEAGRASTYTFETRMDCTAKPVLDTGV